MDRYQSLCECTQIALTVEDEQRLRHAHFSLYEAFAREAVNKGLRKITFDQDCCQCGGSGVLNLRHAA
jgi:hypothetical protein